MSPRNPAWRSILQAQGLLTTDRSEAAASGPLVRNEGCIEGEWRVVPGTGVVFVRSGEGAPHPFPLTLPLPVP
jgi:hypothetical protein